MIELWCHHMIWNDIWYRDTHDLWYEFDCPFSRYFWKQAAIYSKGPTEWHRPPTSPRDLKSLPAMQVCADRTFYAHRIVLAAESEARSTALLERSIERLAENIGLGGLNAWRFSGALVTWNLQSLIMIWSWDRWLCAAAATPPEICLRACRGP